MAGRPPRGRGTAGLRVAIPPPTPQGANSPLVRAALGSAGAGAGEEVVARGGPGAMGGIAMGGPGGRAGPGAVMDPGGRAGNGNGSAAAAAMAPGGRAGNGDGGAGNGADYPMKIIPSIEEIAQEVINTGDIAQVMAKLIEIVDADGYVPDNLKEVIINHGQKLFVKEYDRRVRARSPIPLVFDEILARLNRDSLGRRGFANTNNTGTYNALRGALKAKNEGVLRALKTKMNRAEVLTLEEQQALDDAILRSDMVTSGITSGFAGKFVGSAAQIANAKLATFVRNEKPKIPLKKKVLQILHTNKFNNFITGKPWGTLTDLNRVLLTADAPLLDESILAAGLDFAHELENSISENLDKDAFTEAVQNFLTTLDINIRKARIKNYIALINVAVRTNNGDLITQWSTRGTTVYPTGSTNEDGSPQLVNICYFTEGALLKLEDEYYERKRSRDDAAARAIKDLISQAAAEEAKIFAMSGGLQLLQESLSNRGPEFFETRAPTINTATDVLARLNADDKKYPLRGGKRAKQTRRGKHAKKHGKKTRKQ